MISRQGWMINWLLSQQEVYEDYWVKNIWGFGDKMRDYLLEGNRRVRYGHTVQERPS